MRAARCWHRRRCRRASACSTWPAAPASSPSTRRARSVPSGQVLGVDISGHMVDAARERAHVQRLSNVALRAHGCRAARRCPMRASTSRCARSASCTCPTPSARCARCGACCGRAAASSSPCGENDRAADGRRCFRSSMPRSRATCARCSSASGSRIRWRACVREAQFEAIEQRRIATTLIYADADEACNAAFVGGPVALAWSRFDDDVRARVRERYVQAIEPWRHGDGYRMPGEFVVVAALAPRVPLTEPSTPRRHAPSCSG